MQLASYPVGFSIIARPPEVSEERKIFFTCASSHVVGLLAIFNNLLSSSSNLKSNPIKKESALYNHILIEDGVFCRYSAVLNGEVIGFKALASMLTIN